MAGEKDTAAEGQMSIRARIPLSRYRYCRRGREVTPYCFLNFPQSRLGDLGESVSVVSGYVWLFLYPLCCYILFLYICCFILSSLAFLYFCFHLF